MIYATLSAEGFRKRRRQGLGLLLICLAVVVAGKSIASYRYAHIPYRRVIVPSVYPKFSQQVDGVVFSPDGQTVASVDYFGVSFWSVPQLKPERQFNTPAASEIFSIAWQSDGRTLALGEMDWAARWDLSSNNLTRLPFRPHIHLPCGGTPCYLYNSFQTVISPSGNLVAAASTTGAVAVWDTMSGHQLFALSVPPPGKYEPSENVYDIAISPDDKLVATTSMQEYDTPVMPKLDIMIRKATTGLPLQKWQWKQATLNVTTGTGGGNLGETGLTFSPDGSLLATADNIQVAVWNTQNGTLLQTLAVPLPSDVGGYGGKKRLIFFNRNRLLVGIGWGTAILIWDVRTGALIQTFYSRNTNFLAASAISPDDKWLATGGEFDHLELWDVGRLLR